MAVTTPAVPLTVPRPVAVGAADRLRMRAPATGRRSRDGELPKHGLLLISAIGSLAIAGILVLIRHGSEWMAAFAVVAALIGVASLMAMMTWLMSPTRAGDPRGGPSPRRAR